jgi:dTDP-4-dehydrorhamnose 3,5-epimerase
MKVVDTPLEGLKVVEPTVHGDARGFFLETFHEGRFAEGGLPTRFVQDNWSRSQRHTLRGLHYQHPGGQGKLVWCVTGEVYDVVVDVRRGSPTFGRWFALELSEANKKQLWVPPGFAHGFCVLSAWADFVYKCTTPYAPANEAAVRWDDPALGIPWPTTTPLISAKDAAAPLLAEQRNLPGA